MAAIPCCAAQELDAAPQGRVRSSPASPAASPPLPPYEAHPLALVAWPHVRALMLHSASLPQAQVVWSGRLGSGRNRGVGACPLLLGRVSWAGLGRAGIGWGCLGMEVELGQDWGSREVLMGGPLGLALVWKVR